MDVDIVAVCSVDGVPRSRHSLRAGKNFEVRRHIDAADEAGVALCWDGDGCGSYAVTGDQGFGEGLSYLILSPCVGVEAIIPGRTARCGALIVAFEIDLR